MTDLTSLILTQLQDPKNRKIVNEAQPYFKVDFRSGLNTLELTIIGAEKNGSNLATQIFIPDIARLCTLNAFNSMMALFIVRWCINLLPCFDVENPNIKTLLVARSNLCDKIEERYFATNGNGPRFMQVELGRLMGILESTPQTIRQALLTCGAMNLDELEKYALDNNLIPTI